MEDNQQLFMLWKRDFLFFFFNIKIQYKQTPTDKPVLRCINCKQINCHTQCHQINYEKHADDPSACNKIDLSGNCLVCKCHQSLHKKIKSKVNINYKKQNKVNQKMKEKYLEAQGKFNPRSKDYQYKIYTRKGENNILLHGLKIIEKLSNQKFPINQYLKTGFEEMKSKFEQLKKNPVKNIAKRSALTKIIHQNQD